MGLVDQIRCEGCLLPGTSRSQSPEISTVPFAEYSMLVSLSSIWPILRPSHFYRIDEASSCASEAERNQADYISGWVSQGFVPDVGSDDQWQVSLPKDKVVWIQKEAKQLHSKMEVSVQEITACVSMTTPAK